MNGILNLHKPTGITSHDVVARIRRASRIKRVGHACTLDPMATGVLLLCIGQATRLSEYLMGGRKVYQAEVTFGSVTDTQDSSGRVLEVRDASHLTEEALRSLLPQFTGEILQVPPMVSALHHEGKRLYDLARQGIEVAREPRPITVFRLESLCFDSGPPPRATLEVECSSGTYIRTLAHDIGEAAGCGAHMSALERCAVGAFTLEGAVKIEEAEERAKAGNLPSLLSPMKKALEGHPVVQLTPHDMEAMRFGRSIPAPPEMENADPVGLIGTEGGLVALARCRDGILQPFKVLLGG